MLDRAIRGGLALLLCAAIGCQEMHEISKYDPLIWRQPPDSEPASAIAAASPRLPSADAEPHLHYVSYAPGDSTPTSAPVDGSASKPAPNAAAISTPSGDSPGLLSLSHDPPTPKPKWADSMITRGQTPLRQVFASDRAVIAAIVIAAVIIPFAIHDSREANPPIR